MSCWAWSLLAAPSTKVARLHAYGAVMWDWMWEGSSRPRQVASTGVRLKTALRWRIPRHTLGRRFEVAAGFVADVRLPRLRVGRGTGITTLIAPRHDVIGEVPVSRDSADA